MRDEQEAEELLVDRAVLVANDGRQVLLKLLEHFLEDLQLDLRV